MCRYAGTTEERFDAIASEPDEGDVTSSGSTLERCRRARASSLISDVRKLERLDGVPSIASSGELRETERRRLEE